MLCCPPVAIGRSGTTRRRQTKPLHAFGKSKATHGRVTMADTWLTIEQAAVTLGLSVRTVNRHINAGKIQSRLQDGRREVLVRIPDDAADVEADEETASTAARSGASASRSASAGAQQTGRFEETTDTSDHRDGNGYGQSSRHGASAVPHERDAGPAGGYDTSGHQMETMLALADNAADK